MGDVHHIEIDKNAVEELGKLWENLLQTKDDITESFKNALRSMHNMNGGLGNAAEAAEQLQNRRTQVDEAAKFIARLPGVNLQHFIRNVDDADLKASLLAIQDERALEAEKNYFAVIAAHLDAEGRKKFLKSIADEGLRKDMEERLQKALLAQMEWDLARAKEKWRRESEESGFRLAPQSYGEQVFRNVGDKWTQWGDEGSWGIVKKVGLSAAAIVAFACAVYLSGGSIAAVGGESALKSAAVFGIIGGLVSGTSTKLQGGSWEETFINGGIGAGLGALGGAGFGWGLAIKSGMVMFVSGALTSGLSSTIAAMRSGQEIDAELLAEIYTKAMLSGTIDMALGKLLAGAPPLKSIGYKTNIPVTQRYTTTFQFKIDPKKIEEITPKTFRIGDTQIGDEVILFPKTVPDAVKELIKPTHGGVISGVKPAGPVSMTVGESFSVPVMWTESYTQTFREILSAETLATIANLNRKYGGAFLPSYGQMISRGVFDKEKSGVITDTFFIPEPKKQ